ncbi:hypothetical protein IU459_23805 [Nocardia amamiensis]|uniref:Uncharacterized protein n=1 Tax=Nocardia amamiensis TaxID=404578 RepID=A0ABS0CVB5_9NOCA|nr:hypothetical protein [Nocardia amamiensis]MBF6300546.1 hypothetical protein [Nocardia amamiensis]
MTDEMPTLYVPDVYSSRWPAERLKLSVPIHDWLDKDTEVKSLFTILKEDWQAFGEKPRPKVPPRGTVPPVDLTSARIRSGMFESYVQVNDSLKRAFDAMQQQDVKVQKKIEDSKITTETAQGYLRKLIADLNIEAEKPPVEMSEDQHVMAYITAGMEKSLQIMTGAKSEQERHAEGIDGDTALTKELVARIKALEDAAKNPALNPPSVPPVSPTPPGTTEPPYVDDSTLPPGLDGLDDGSSPDSLTPPGLDDSGLNGQSPSSPGNLGNTPGTTPTSPGVQPVAAPSPVGSGMDMLGPMMQAMQQQALMRQLADQDSRRRELDPSRFEDEVAPVTPQPVTPQPVTAQPATAQQSATAPATQHGQPTGTTSSTQPAGAPARIPDADGSVMYTHPDGVTEKLNVTAAQAFDKAYGNHSDTDAQKAYEGTPAWWKDEEALRLLRVMPEEEDRFTSGCVVMFKGGKTALLRVAPDKGDGFHVVIKGELKPFDQNMPELATEEGSFDGFRRPNGIDVTAPVDKGTPLSTPGSADQSANTTMPVVAAG